MNELMVMLPAYNEEENLEVLVHQWQAYKDEIQETFDLYLRIVVTNDGSKDRTKEIGEMLQGKFDNFTLVNHEKNKGLGQAVKTGIIYILENYPHSVFTCIMDCDNTHDPRYVLDMLNKQKETSADVIIASRYQEGSKVKGVSPFRLFTSEGAKYVYSLILRVKEVRDYTCGYRLYNNSLLNQTYLRFGDHLVEERGFTCMAELLYKLYACGGTFSEVPFELRYDLKGGASKMKVIKTAVDSVGLALKLKKLRKEKRGVMPMEFAGRVSDL